jgi:hypothetical protein
MIIEFWKTGENPITCYKSMIVSHNKTMQLKPKIKKENKLKRPLTIEYKNGYVEEYPSVLDASVALRTNYSTLCAYLNGKAKNPTDFTIYRSKINKKKS